MSNVETPDYLPARMLNEFVYCPRLFYYEWVEGVFAHNRETVEGALRHSNLDDKQDALTPADELAPEDQLHSRSVSLSSDARGLIAKMDLIEVANGTVTPVDYKRGAPRKNEAGEIDAWDADRIQLAVQGVGWRPEGERERQGRTGSSHWGNLSGQCVWEYPNFHAGNSGFV